LGGYKYRNLPQVMTAYALKKVSTPIQMGYHHDVSPNHNEESSQFVDWRTIAAWIETQGSIDSTINRRRGIRGLRPFINRSIRIMQRYREALDVLSIFLRTQNVKSTIRYVKPSKKSFGRTPYFSLNILSVSDMDVVIANAFRFFITNKARRQVERYTRFRHATAAELRVILEMRQLNDPRPAARKKRAN
jgi:hypothetical protein